MAMDLGPTGKSSPNSRGTPQGLGEPLPETDLPQLSILVCLALGRFWGERGPRSRESFLLPRLGGSCGTLLRTPRPKEQFRDRQEVLDQRLW